MNTLVRPQTMCFYPALPVPLDLPVSTSAPHPCPYLPGLAAVTRGFRGDRVPGGAYQEFLDAGFRRSGRVFYQVACPGCRACRSIRVPTDTFRPSKAQRRLARRNRDLAVSWTTPILTAEKHELYRRYLAARHRGEMTGSWSELREFLYRSPTDTIEVTYRSPEGALLGVGLCDVTPQALSSVYFYFEPQEGRRGLGIFSSLVELRLAAAAGLPYYHLGYWVEGCPKMEYKAQFQPNELLCTDAVWRPFEEA
jgi:leucyl-tRNA---protein transferase